MQVKSFDISILIYRKYLFIFPYLLSKVYEPTKKIFLYDVTQKWKGILDKFKIARFDKKDLMSMISISLILALKCCYRVPAMWPNYF